MNLSISNQLRLQVYRIWRSWFLLAYNFLCVHLLSLKSLTSVQWAKGRQWIGLCHVHFSAWLPEVSPVLTLASKATLSFFLFPFLSNKKNDGEEEIEMEKKRISLMLLLLLDFSLKMTHCTLVIDLSSDEVYRQIFLFVIKPSLYFFTYTSFTTKMAL